MQKSDFFLQLCIVPSPPGIKRGNDFCVISQAVGATAKLPEPEWGHIQGGKMILGSQAGGWTALS